MTITWTGTRKSRNHCRSEPRHKRSANVVDFQTSSTDTARANGTTTLSCVSMPSRHIFSNTSVGNNCSSSEDYGMSKNHPHPSLSRPLKDGYVPPVKELCIYLISCVMAKADSPATCGKCKPLASTMSAIDSSFPQARTESQGMWVDCLSNRMTRSPTVCRVPTS